MKKAIVFLVLASAMLAATCTQAWAGTPIPGLTQGYIPQGMCIAGNNTLVISAYKAGADSALFLINRNRPSDPAKRVVLEGNREHVGGVVFDGVNLWVCGTGETATMWAYRWDTVRAAPASVKQIAKQVVEVQTSFATVYKDRIYLGGFNSRFDGPVRSYVVKDKAKSRPWLQMAGDQPVTNCPPKTQGMAFGIFGGVPKVIFSTSEGRHNSSRIRAMRFLLGRYQTYGEISRQSHNMSQAILADGNYTYVLYESGASAYKDHIGCDPSNCTRKFDVQEQVELISNSNWVSRWDRKVSSKTASLLPSAVMEALIPPGSIDPTPTTETTEVLPPITLIEGPGEEWDWVSADVTVTLVPAGTADASGDSTWYRLDAGTPQKPLRQVDGSLLFRVTEPGEHVIEAWSLDALGVEEQPHRFAKVNIDRAAPQVAGRVQPVFRGGSSIALNANDDLSGVSHWQYRIDDGTPVTVEGSDLRVNDVSESGLHDIEYFAYDRAGNATRGTADFTVVKDFHHFVPAGLQTPFGEPRAIAEAGDGTAFVLDASRPRVYRVNASGVPIDEFSGFGPRFMVPVDMAVDRVSQFVYMLYPASILKFTFSGEMVSQWELGDGGDPGRISDAVALAVDDAGSIWIADRGSGRIVQLDTTGEYAGEFLAQEHGSLVAPLEDLAVARDGSTVIACSRSYPAEVGLWRSDGSLVTTNVIDQLPEGARVPCEALSVTPTGFAIWLYYGELVHVGLDGTVGTSTRLAAGQFSDLSIASDGLMWVVDRDDKTLRVLASDGVELSRSSYGANARAGSFSSPQGIAIAPNGDIVVADYGNSRVARLAPDGAVKGYLGADANGIPDGTLSEPTDVAVMSDGTMLVADRWNSVLRFNPAGALLGSLEAHGGRVMAGDISPIALSVEGSGSVLVLSRDWGDDTYSVERYASSGEYLGVVAEMTLTSYNGAPLSMGLASDSRGRVYVEDPEGGGTLRFSPGADAPERLPLWGEIVIDQRDHLWTDYNGGVAEYNEGIELVQSWGGRYGSGDEEFSCVGGIAVNSGNVYVADSLNHRIQRMLTDTTAPTTYIRTSPDAGTGWANRAVAVELLPDDGLGRGVAATKIELGDRVWRDYTSPITASAEGEQTLSFYSVDKAGNIEGTRTATVRIDCSAPVSTASVSGGSTKRVAIKATDTFSGVAAIYTRLGSAAPSNAVVHTFTSPGTYQVEYWAVDGAGNVEDVHTVSVVVPPGPGVDVGDNAAPVTTASGAIGTWASDNVAVSLSAVDVGGGVVAATYYRVGDGQSIRYVEPITVTDEGASTLSFYSLDSATPPNVEHEQSVIIRIDRTPPPAPDYLTYSSLTPSTAVLTWPTTTDGFSGIARYEVLEGNRVIQSVSEARTTVKSLIPGQNYSFAVRAVDNAGNVSSITRLDLDMPKESDSLRIVPSPSTTVTLPVPAADSTSAARSAIVTVTISGVTQGGELSVVRTMTPPYMAPANFKFLGEYFDVSFSGVFDGAVIVSLPYDPRIPDARALRFRLQHWVGHRWERVPTTVDLANHTITATLTSLSPIVVAESEDVSSSANVVLGQRVVPIIGERLGQVTARTLDASGTPLAGFRLALERRDGESWSRVQTCTVDGSGRVSALAGLLRGNATHYRWVFVDTEYYSGVSDEAVLLPTAVLSTPRLAASRVKRGAPIIVSGSIAPSHAGRVTLSLYKKQGTKWVFRRAAVASANGSGRYRVRIVLTRTGVYHVVAKTGSLSQEAIAAPGRSRPSAIVAVR